MGFVLKLGLALLGDALCEWIRPTVYTESIDWIWTTTGSIIVENVETSTRRPWEEED